MKSSPTAGNLVFSPLSLHAAIAMLTSGATDASVTQEELLGALGRSRNIQALEATYKDILEEYLVFFYVYIFGNSYVVYYEIRILHLYLTFVFAYLLCS